MSLQFATLHSANLRIRHILGQNLHSLESWRLSRKCARQEVNQVAFSCSNYARESMSPSAPRRIQRLLFWPPPFHQRGQSSQLHLPIPQLRLSPLLDLQLASSTWMVSSHSSMESSPLTSWKKAWKSALHSMSTQILLLAALLLLWEL